MKFSVGDRVLLKQTGEEGFITAFLGKQMMEVDVAGTRFPVYADELDHPYLRWFTEQKPAQPKRRVEEIPVEKPAVRKERLSRGIYLSFIPHFTPGSTDDIIESFRIHLLNETAEHIDFHYNARSVDGASLLELKGSLHPFANLFLHDLSLGTMNAQPRFHWQMAPRRKPDGGIRNVLRIRPAQLVRQLEELLESGAPAFSILLAQDAEAIPEAQPTEKSVTPAFASNAAPAVQLRTMASAVLDLHIQALPEDVAGLNAGALLELQLSLLRRKLDAGLGSGLERMIVIHGLGKGTLREAVHELLRDTPYVRSFSNYWTGAYGWGATEVIFGKA